MLAVHSYFLGGTQRTVDALAFEADQYGDLFLQEANAAAIAEVQEHTIASLLSGLYVAVCTPFSFLVLSVSGCYSRHSSCALFCQLLAWTTDTSCILHAAMPSTRQSVPLSYECCLVCIIRLIDYGHPILLLCRAICFSGAIIHNTCTRGSYGSCIALHTDSVFFSLTSLYCIVTVCSSFCKIPLDYFMA